MTDDEIKAFIARERWTFAKSMPTNPHEYVVRKQVAVEADFVRFALHIREHGYRMKFKGWLYTCFDVDGFRYWTMGNPIEITTIINRARNET